MKRLAMHKNEALSRSRAKQNRGNQEKASEKRGSSKFLANLNKGDALEAIRLSISDKNKTTKEGNSPAPAKHSMGSSSIGVQPNSKAALGLSEQTSKNPAGSRGAVTRIFSGR